MCRASSGVIGLATLWFTGAVALVPQAVAAGELELAFDSVFSGSAPALAGTPWVDALFQDVSPGTVRLTISDPGLRGSEDVDRLYLNLNPKLNPKRLVFTVLDQSGSFCPPSIQLGANALKAGGGGRYDIGFGFSQKNRFTGNDSLVLEIAGIPGLTSSDFDYLSQGGGPGPFYAAAHVQRIGAAKFSGWINGTPPESVPEPESAILLGLGAMACAVAWFGRRSVVRGTMKVPA